MAATVWKGNISFGLVSFPVRLSAAARGETLHFHMLHAKDDSRLKEVWYCEKENKPVERSEIVKGFEYAKGRYIVVTDAELKKVAPATASTMEILQFVKAEDVDPLLFEKSYYVAPEPSGVKPYGLLRKAMTDKAAYAVAKLTMHTREHIVIIRPSDAGLVLHTMFFPNELHEENRAKGADSKYSSKEIDLAYQLVVTLTGAFRPDRFKDEYKENVERMIREKKRGREVTPVTQPKAAPVVDILDALRRSLEGAKPKSPGDGQPGKRAAQNRGRKAA